MQQPSPYATNRRVGCLMWLTVLAIAMSGLGLLVDLSQELAWDGRIEQLNTLYTNIYTPPQSNNASESESANEPIPATAQEVSTVAQVAPVSIQGVTYEQICGVDESNMTDPQLEAHALSFANRTFSGWQGWVYDVVSKTDGAYDLEIAMTERNPFWGRDIVIENIPTDLAMRLNVEQVLVFDGRVAQVDYTFEVMCNPMIVDNFVLR